MALVKTIETPLGNAMELLNGLCFQSDNGKLKEIRTIRINGEDKWFDMTDDGTPKRFLEYIYDSESIMHNDAIDKWCAQNPGLLIPDNLNEDYVLLNNVEMTDMRPIYPLEEWDVDAFGQLKKYTINGVKATPQEFYAKQKEVLANTNHIAVLPENTILAKYPDDKVNRVGCIVAIVVAIIGLAVAGISFFHR